MRDHVVRDANADALVMPRSDSHQDDDEDDSCLRILLATDIHLGYKEKDPHRSGDSFAAFEEILQVARRRQVDLLLLGGDLFHENKPTRDAEKRCLDLLQRYVLGDGAIQIEFLSDPEVNFAHCQRRELNYMNPNMVRGIWRSSILRYRGCHGFCLR